MNIRFAPKPSTAALTHQLKPMQTPKSIPTLNRPNKVKKL